jgi:hypothetical protein
MKAVLFAWLARGVSLVVFACSLSAVAGSISITHSFANANAQTVLPNAFFTYAVTCNGVTSTLNLRSFNGLPTGETFGSVSNIPDNAVCDVAITNRPALKPGLVYGPASAIQYAFEDIVDCPSPPANAVVCRRFVVGPGADYTMFGLNYARTNVANLTISNTLNGTAFLAGSKYPYSLTCGANTTTYSLGQFETARLLDLTEGTVCQLSVLSNRPGLAANSEYAPAPTFAHSNTTGSACQAPLPTNNLVCTRFTLAAAAGTTASETTVGATQYARSTVGSFFIQNMLGPVGVPAAARFNYELVCGQQTYTFSTAGNTVSGGNSYRVNAIPVDSACEIRLLKPLPALEQFYGYTVAPTIARAAGGPLSTCGLPLPSNVEACKSFTVASAVENDVYIDGAVTISVGRLAFSHRVGVAANSPDYAPATRFPMRVDCGGTLSTYSLLQSEQITLNNIPGGTVCEIYMLGPRPPIPNHTYLGAPSFQDLGVQITPPSACAAPLPVDALACTRYAIGAGKLSVTVAVQQTEALGFTLRSSLNPAIVGMPVNLTAAMSVAGVTGAANFRTVGGASLSGCDNVALVNGVATCALDTSVPGTISVEAVYLPGNQASATTTTLVQTVSRCDLDIDRSDSLRAPTDGLLVLRRLLNITGAPLVNAVIEPVPTARRTQPADVAAWIDAQRVTGVGGNRPLDLDDDGAVNASTDGLMLLRAMLGLRGDAVTQGALGAIPRGRSDWGSIRMHLNSVCGTAFE